MLPMISSAETVGELVVTTTSDYRLVSTLINAWHSMRTAPAGWRVAFVLTDGINVYGVSTFGRPVARHEDQVHTLEHTRMALGPAAPRNAASYFMARCRRWIRHHMPEITRLIAYVPSDKYWGATYRTDNWRVVYEAMPKHSSWQTRPNRHGIANELRTKFETKP